MQFQLYDCGIVWDTVTLMNIVQCDYGKWPTQTTFAYKHKTSDLGKLSSELAKSDMYYPRLEPLFLDRTIDRANRSVSHQTSSIVL